ncbi:vacuolar protein 14 C-terminal Fig4p binding-domain-containing protein [Suillus subalutaceus]|uniref:vacuolar protein 14 C-terminal Fig4p binding-domain-containing protein n=1 Tax=Suillus subalutaceus TaxID=48586 RepID=UPI001B85CB3F|nr:vacuolar protein 14 C-terminal Fig4p binding-domain-containing protein [Suillus subalutaceus]KAG1838182.1 vacuolar protein 14 C-terminal Fig4p binding-domain-containing protein [Suillus subalutaceus]
MQTTVMESSSRPRSRTSSNSVLQLQLQRLLHPRAGGGQFNYQATVNELTIQFLSQHEQIRVAALKWRIMLHQKALKQLPAQTLSSSEESYFKDFMMDLFELFSTDRKLLEACGSPIIHQSCLSLNTERIYETFAEILEKEEVARLLWIWSLQANVQMLNMILITLPEQFRKRLKGLETGLQDGQALFTTLYRSWCHNAIAVFSLCMLAQDYEHASNLLSISDQISRIHFRLNGVNSAGFLHIAPKAQNGKNFSIISLATKQARESATWDLGNTLSQDDITITLLSLLASGDLPVLPIIPPKPTLSPLNPKARQNGLMAGMLQGVMTPGGNATEDEADSGLTCGGTQEGENDLTQSFAYRDVSMCIAASELAVNKGSFKSFPWTLARSYSPGRNEVMMLKVGLTAANLYLEKDGNDDSCPILSQPAKIESKLAR